MIGLLDAATSGVGVYTVPEAARYANLPAATLRGWFFPKSDRAVVRPAGVDDKNEKVLTFLDLVEAIAIRALRVDHNVKLKSIRTAIGVAEKQYGLKHIFAREDHQVYFSELNRELYIRLKDEPDPVGISGEDLGQKHFKALFQGYMRNLRFQNGNLADLYIAYRYEDQKVVLNPKFRFGEPTIEENGYPVDVLWRAAIVEGGFERAAQLYEVSESSVRTAYEYCSRELGMAA